MPIPAINSEAVPEPTTEYNAIRFCCYLDDGEHQVLKIWKCRVLAGDLWEQQPRRGPVTLVGTDVQPLRNVLWPLAVAEAGAGLKFVAIESKIADTGQLTGSVVLITPDGVDEKGQAKTKTQLITNPWQLAGLADVYAAVAAINAEKGGV